MKLELVVRRKDGTPLYEGVHEIVDAESFGRAFTHLWAQVHERQLQSSTSIGALMETLNEGVLEELQGAVIGFRKVS